MCNWPYCLDVLQPWIASVPDSPLAGKASTRFRFQESGWSLADVDIRLGQSDLHGHLARSFSENGPLLSARLTSNLLEIAELTGLITGFGDETAPAASAALPGLVIDDEWIEKWFTLPSVDFEFDVKRIAGIDYDVGSVNIVGHVRERLIEDSHLSLDFERINIAGDINADFRHKPWKLAYHVDADHLDIGHLLARFELADDISIGAKHLDLDFISEGQSISDLLLHSRL